MKKTLQYLILILAACTVYAHADTLTPRAGLTKPVIGSPNWGPKINANYDIMDSSFDVLNGTQTHSGINGFTGAVHLGYKSLFLYEVTGSTYANVVAAAFASTRTYTVPDAGGDAEFVLDGNGLANVLHSTYTLAADTLTLTGELKFKDGSTQVAASSGIVHVGAAGEVAYYANNGTTLDGIPYLLYSTGLLDFTPVGTGTFRLRNTGSSGYFEINPTGSGADVSMGFDTGTGHFRLVDRVAPLLFWEYDNVAPAIRQYVDLDLDNHQLMNVTTATAVNVAADTVTVQSGVVLPYLPNAILSTNASGVVVSTTVNGGSSPNVVVAVSTTQENNNVTNTYAASSFLTLSITTTNNSSRVRLDLNAQVRPAGVFEDLTIQRGGTDLSTALGTGALSTCNFVSASAVGECPIVFMDTPGPAGTYTYTVYFRGENGPSVNVELTPTISASSLPSLSTLTATEIP